VLSTIRSGNGGLSLARYCQMLCMGLGGDPLFNNPIDKFYSINNFSEAFRVV
jgi:hypothetical protein